MYLSKKRGPLLRIDELVVLFGKSESSVKRRLKEKRDSKQTVYCETVKEQHSTGGMRVVYYDPAALGWEFSAQMLSSQGQISRDPDCQQSGSVVGVTLSSQGHAASTPPETAFITDVLPQIQKQSGSENMTLTAGFPDPAALLLAGNEDGLNSLYLDSDSAVLTKHADLLPILNAPKNSKERSEAINELAATRNTTTRTIRREVERVEKLGLDGLKTHKRADAGTFRLPLETLQLVVSALVSNPPTTSVNFVHRTLVRAVPEAMTLERSGQPVTVTAVTVGKVRRMMLEHPVMRLLFADADRRKEFLRSYSGQVVALHANDMWQLDMTRCDVEVVNVETRQMYRPRVQAVIDVYSGCIMGLSFSQAEDQAQADIALMRSLMPKSGPLAERYPVFGVPRRLYIDNGKTYSSAHFHRIAAGLGIEVIHSLPRVSHTRGAVERFFGTLHGLERTMAGYVGSNAADRSSGDLSRLRANTTRWLDGGKDPGERQRLQTIQEYQSTVLAWLIVEYHAWMVNGQTRLEHFRETAPAHTLLQLDPAELLLLFARREVRLVRPDGTVSLGNVAWTIPNGKLAQYRGMKVILLEDQFVLGDGSRGVAFEDRAGKLQLLGQAVPAPTIAASVEAGDLRRAQKAQKQAALRQADELTASLSDPALMVGTQLRRELPVQAVTPVEPAARARLQVITPDSVPDLGDFGRSFLKPPEDFQALLNSIKEDE